MEQPSVNQIDHFASVAVNLEKAESCLFNCDWHGVLQHCRAYLLSLPIDRSLNDQNGSHHVNFQKLAKHMLDANHTFESVLQLVEWKIFLLDLIEPFFSELGKKGVHLPTPTPGPPESRFVYESVAAYHKLIMHWLV